MLQGRFRLHLTLLVALGLNLRLLYIAFAPPQYEQFDMAFYHFSANLLAEGNGYVDPYSGETTMVHPPLYPFLLAGLSLVGLESPQAHRLVGMVAGAVLIVLAGLLGRRVAGERAGLVAAAIAAVYPVLIRADATLMAETVYAPLVVGMLLVALRLVERPRRREAVLLGALVGLAVLCRLEALAFLVLVVLPVAWLARGQRLAVGGLALLATVLVVTPWVVRNQAEFGGSPRIALNGDAVIGDANCPLTYRSGRDLGGWRVECWQAEGVTNEADAYGELRRQGIEYALDNVDRWPVVVAARLARTFGLRQTGIGDGFDAQASAIKLAGHVLYFLLVPLAVAGAVLLRRRRAVLLLLLAPVIATVLSTTIGWGLPRFRHGAEVPLVVLASVALVWLADRYDLAGQIGRRRRAPASAAGGREHVAA